MFEKSINLHKKSGSVGSESENESENTKDTSFQGCPDPIFKLINNFLKNTWIFILKTPPILGKICNGTSSSDKIIRLTSAIIKFMKSFQILANVTKYDKLNQQVSQLRRLLRVNRLLMNIKEYMVFFRKKIKKGRDFFDVFFKTVMLLCDINDILAYLMQLRIIRQIGLSTLKKNVSNLYFLECVMWTSQHLYDYFTKDKTEAQISSRRVTIGKYLMDTTVSHNDFSMRLFTVGAKQSTIFGLISSIVGLVLIWK